MKASAVEKTDRQMQRRDRAGGRRERPRLIDDEAQRNEHDRAADHRARGRQHRIDPLELAAEDRGARIADGGGHDRQFRDELMANARECSDADDQADADHAGDDAEELPGGRGLPAGRDTRSAGT